jgi:hypothetical protein
MAQKEKELCLGRKTFNMDPMKVLWGRGEAGRCVLGSSELSIPSGDTITGLLEQSPGPQSKYSPTPPLPGGSLIPLLQGQRQVRPR